MSHVKFLVDASMTVTATNVIFATNSAAMIHRVMPMAVTKMVVMARVVTKRRAIVLNALTPVAIPQGKFVVHRCECDGIIV